MEAFDDKECETFRLLLRRVACHVRDIDPTTDPCDVATDALAADGVAGR